MKKSTWYWAFGIIVIIAGIFYFTRGSDAVPGKYDDFAKCLTNSGAKMYGAYWCSHCADQKKVFGTSVKYLPYVECDPRGSNADVRACDEAGIDAFPTWIFSDGAKNKELMSLRQLAVKTGCELPAERTALQNGT